jgi:hypothetical protein
VCLFYVGYCCRRREAVYFMLVTVVGDVRLCLFHISRFHAVTIFWDGPCHSLGG